MSNDVVINRSHELFEVCQSFLGVSGKFSESQGSLENLSVCLAWPRPPFCSAFVVYIVLYNPDVAHWGVPNALFVRMLPPARCISTNVCPRSCSDLHSRAASVAPKCPSVVYVLYQYQLVRLENYLSSMKVRQAPDTLSCHVPLAGSSV